MLRPASKRHVTLTPQTALFCILYRQHIDARKQCIQISSGCEWMLQGQTIQIFRIHASFESRCIPEKCIQITNDSLHLSLSWTVNVCIQDICSRNAATAAHAAPTVPAHLFNTNIAIALQSLVRQKSYLHYNKILIVIYTIVFEKN